MIMTERADPNGQFLADKNCCSTRFPIIRTFAPPSRFGTMKFPRLGIKTSTAPAPPPRRARPTPSVDDTLRNRTAPLRNTMSKRPFPGAATAPNEQLQLDRCESRHNTAVDYVIFFRNLRKNSRSHYQTFPRWKPRWCNTWF